jgi:hypothetical protein
MALFKLIMLRKNIFGKALSNEALHGPDSDYVISEVSSNIKNRRLYLGIFD